MTKIPFLIILLFGVFIKPTWADHNGTANVQNLNRAVDQLYYQVYYSTLHYGVKESVYRFTSDVRYLHRCVTNFPPADVQKSTQDDHTGYVPAACRTVLNRVRSSFYPVERYLYDTQYDYPNIYQQYRRTRYILSLVH